MVTTLTSDNFDKEVLQADGKVLVDFWATWCGPCKMLSPIVEAVAEENPNLKVGKVDVDDQQMLARKYKVMSIPTLILFENGQVVRQNVGFISKDQVIELTK